MQVGAFPIDSEALNKFKTLYETGRGLVILLLPVLVIARACLNLMYFKNSEDYLEIIKDLVLASVLLGSFMFFIQQITEIPTYYADLLKDYATYEVKLESSSPFEYFPMMAWFMIACYWVCYVIYFICLALVCAFGSYLIVAGTMFQSYWVLKATFWLLVVLASWPLIWYTINLFINILTKDGTSFSSLMIIVVLTAAKLLVPFLAFLKIWNSSPANHVKSAAQMATAATSFAGSGLMKTSNKVGNATLGTPRMDGFKDRLKDSSKVMSTVGVSAASVVAQTAKSQIKSASSFISSQALPNRAIQSFSNGSEKISSVFKNNQDPYTGKDIPLSSKAGLALKSISPTIHSQAKGLLKDSAITNKNNFKPKQAFKNNFTMPLQNSNYYQKNAFKSPPPQPLPQIRTEEV